MFTKFFALLAKHIVEELKKFFEDEIAKLEGKPSGQ